MSVRGWIGSFLLIVMIVAGGVLLAAWKSGESATGGDAAAPEPMESVTVAVAKSRSHRDATTSIGTVLALRSVTLRNEVAGTVREIALTPGEIVEEGASLVALDISVEKAELEAQKAQAALAETLLERLHRLSLDRAAPELDVHRARAERDVALAAIARTKAIIDRKVIRAPFRARVGLTDIHPGQYLNEGAVLTTLQGVDDAAHVDFAVPQDVAQGLKPGDRVGVFAGIEDDISIPAKIVAIDARVDTATRNAVVRARIEGKRAPAPGASVRVSVPVGPARKAVAVPVSALRKGPGGDHVFVIEADKDGNSRVHLRQVQSGGVAGDEILIVSGLSEGEKVAASGSFKLRESALVAIANQ